jgi:hypothetical protein
MQMGVDTRPTSPPPPGFEPEDMVAIEPPCHPQEPVKVPEGSQGPYHCLVCRTAFALED